MWALDFLGLDINADDKAIKRAYAKQLKIIRPDDDPIAFQQLNEAYQAALDWWKNTSSLEKKGSSSSNSFNKQKINKKENNSNVKDTVPYLFFKEDMGSETFLDTDCFTKRCINIARQNEPEKLRV